MRFQTRKRRLLLAVTAVILCFGLVIPQITAFAENTLDIGHICSLEVRLAEMGDEESESHAELKEIPMTVNLYRVAEMTPRAEGSTIGSGAVTALTSFDDGSIQMDQFPEGDIEVLTEQLSAFIKENGIEPDRVEEITDHGVIHDLSTGLYLVLTDHIVLGDHMYEFQPSLISLPTTGLIPGAAEGAPDLYPLEYDAKLILKKESIDLFGDVIIEKELDSFQTDLGRATFIFSVEAEKNGESVYSNVLTLTFDGPGIKETIARHIPVGAHVVITEKYTGASYELVTEPTAELVVENEFDSPEPASVFFRNTYDGSQSKGTSVVNHFSFNEEENNWEWDPIENNEI